MRTLVLAAGFGTRMRPITNYVPKALVPVCGKPLLQHTLEQLSSQDTGPFLVNTHYFHEQIVAFGQSCPVPFEISHEKEQILGSGGGIFAARDWLNQDPVFCVVNAEPLKQVELVPLVRQFAASGAGIGLVSAPVKKNATIFAHKGSIDYAGTTADNLHGVPVDSYAFVGVTFFARAVLEMVTESDFSVVPLWSRAAESGAGTIILNAGTDCWWQDIGNPSELAQVHFDCLNGDNPMVPPEQFILDPVNKRAFSGQLDSASRSRVGNAVWFELNAVPERCELSHCIVMAGSVLEDRPYADSLVTPWGAIAL